jgi:hypothetical protein
MAELSESRIVRCPYNLARGYLAKALAPRIESGKPERLTLTANVAGGELEKDVLVTFAAATDPMHFDQPWRIRWKPDGGPYPEFDGELTVRADETYETAQLELKGSYRPPGGALGAAFDWAVGSHIATGTARALLHRIGTDMESRYRHDEAAKEGSPS